ncbi:CAF17-like 4Fe-4S cluster assembly/insertion protein YgfZ [Massilia sp. S19_KUP03_FR1]|uniref:CAF17-like 4Fe-4S cluster assembly/insertion protein YgfZ n=1 Tax=Massilia sp. S19_KUP03_FR1 TaxID=3025503 RepID=UPI003FA52490
MNNWNEYLASLSAPAAAPADDAVGAAHAHFGNVLTAAQLADGFVAPVGNLGLIAAQGLDAATFLHGQLTNDVANLPPGEVRLAGYCTPKGRLQATMLMWRADADAVPTIYLQLPLAVQPGFQKRLSMFVMRAKAKLLDVTGEPRHAVVLGLGGARAEAALREQVATLPATPNTATEGAAGTVLRLADAFNAPRYLWLTSEATALSALPALQKTLALGGTDAWELSGIHAGIAQVTGATFEQFVPQMVNLELVGGVNFKKGCYPGQEIVARSQYLGKLKRRTTLATIADPLAAAGAEVFSLDDPLQPCGMIVNAAPNGAGGVDALVEVKLAALEQEVRLGSTTGARVAFLPMPYVLDALDL